MRAMVSQESQHLGAGSIWRQAPVQSAKLSVGRS